MIIFMSVLGCGDYVQRKLISLGLIPVAFVANGPGASLKVSSVVKEELCKASALHAQNCRRFYLCEKTYTISTT